jgi:hypothetical protein
VEPVTSYRFHELSLVVQQEAAGPGGELTQTLYDLSWVRANLQGRTPSLSFDAVRYADLPWGEEVPDGSGGCKRRLCIAATYPDQIVSRCVPRVLLLARIVESPHSTARPLDQTYALRQLLTQSGPQLFDRWTMHAHLAMLTRLLEQAASYELQAGRDLYEEPLTLIDLMAEVTGAR